MARNSDSRRGGSAGGGGQESAGGGGGGDAPELVVGGGGGREIAALPGDGRELEGGGDVAGNLAEAGDEGFAAKGHALDDGEVGPLVVAFPERERGAIEECAGEEAEPNGEEPAGRAHCTSMIADGVFRGGARF